MVEWFVGKLKLSFEIIEVVLRSDGEVLLIVIFVFLEVLKFFIYDIDDVCLVWFYLKYFRFKKFFIWMLGFVKRKFFFVMICE